MNNELINSYNKNETEKKDSTKESESIKSIVKRDISCATESENVIPKLRLNNNYNINRNKINKNNQSIIITMEKDRFVNQCVFSNMELKKHFNEENKNKNNITNSQQRANTINNISIFHKNINNKNKYIGNSINNNIKLNRIPLSANKYKKELKEESTNTYTYNNHLLQKDFSFNNNNNIYVQTNTLNTYNTNNLLKKDRNYNLDNIKDNNLKNYTNNNINHFFTSTSTSKNNAKINYILSNHNKNSYSHRNMLITTSNNIRDILIDDNNINRYDELNKNRLKYFADIYNYQIIQSHNFNNNNFPPLYFFNNTKNNNLILNNEFYLNNLYNKKSFSLRELYRNMNMNKKFYSHSNLQKKFKNNKKKKKKSFELKITKEKNKYKSISKKKFNLTNLQYKYIPDKNKNNYKLENILTTKKYNNLNTNIKEEYQYFKRKKLIGIYFGNLIRKKINNNKNIKNDILEIGLINSSSQIKKNKENINRVNNLNEKKQKIKKIEIVKNLLDNDNDGDNNKKNFFKMNDIFVRNTMISSLIKNKNNK